jgi:hypothetical protein
VPVLGAITVIDEGEAGMEPDFFQGSPYLTTINGCDVANPSQCSPGLVVTSQNAYDEFVDYIAEEEDDHGYFGDRLVGADSDYDGGAVPSHYSVKKTVGGDQDYAWIMSLAAFAKAKAIENGCYVTATTDDDNDPETLTLRNRTLGTAAEPKICYAEAPLLKNGDGTYADPATGSNEEVSVENSVKGAGVWVIEGELDTKVGSNFTYEGVVVSVGPTAEVELGGYTDVKGAILMASVVPIYEDGDPDWIPPEFQPGGTGSVQYSAEAVAMAQGLLEGWESTLEGGESGQSTPAGTTVIGWYQP